MAFQCSWVVESRVPLRVKESDNAQILFRKGLAAYLHISQAVSPRFFKCLKVIYFMCFACMHVCVPRGCLVPKEVSRGHLQALELELQMVMKHHVEAGY